MTFLDKTSNPTLRAVFFEDAAALVGIVIAVTGLALHQATGQPVWDAIGSILVGLLLGFVAIYLLRRNMDFLVGQIADPRDPRGRARLAARAARGRDGQHPAPGVRRSRQDLPRGSVDLVGDDAESEAAEELQRLEDYLEQRHDIARAVLSLAAPGRTPHRGGRVPVRRHGNNQSG